MQPEFTAHDGSGVTAPQPERQRSRDELVRAHDLLVHIVTTEELREELLDGEILDRVTGALDVLCWALRHDHNPTFGHNLAALNRAMQDLGYELYEEPPAKPDHVPLIERIGNDLAAARMELAAKGKIIAELVERLKEKETEHAR